jgi:hypothetical protein
VHILLAGHPQRASQISRDVLHLYCALRLLLNWHCLTTSYVQHISPPLLVLCVARTREVRDFKFVQRSVWNCLKYTDNSDLMVIGGIAVQGYGVPSGELK